MIFNERRLKQGERISLKPMFYVKCVNGLEENTWFNGETCVYTTLNSSAVYNTLSDEKEQGSVVYVNYESGLLGVIEGKILTWFAVGRDFERVADNSSEFILRRCGVATRSRTDILYYSLTVDNEQTKKINEAFKKLGGSVEHRVYVKYGWEPVKEPQNLFVLNDLAENIEYKEIVSDTITKVLESRKIGKLVYYNGLFIEVGNKAYKSNSVKQLKSIYANIYAEKIEKLKLRGKELAEKFGSGTSQTTDGTSEEIDKASEKMGEASEIVGGTEVEESKTATGEPETVEEEASEPVNETQESLTTSSADKAENTEDEAESVDGKVENTKSEAENTEPIDENIGIIADETDNTLDGLPINLYQSTSTQKCASQIEIMTYGMIFKAMKIGDIITIPNYIFDKMGFNLRSVLKTTDSGKYIGLSTFSFNGESLLSVVDSTTVEEHTRVKICIESTKRRIPESEIETFARAIRVR